MSKLPDKLKAEMLKHDNYVLFTDLRPNNSAMARVGPNNAYKGTSVGPTVDALANVVATALEIQDNWPDRDALSGKLRSACVHLVTIMNPK